MTTEKPRLRKSWTQAMCKACWDKERPGEEPLRAKEVEIERCSFCGMATTSGIYHRADPATVPYPRLVEEGE